MDLVVVLVAFAFFAMGLAALLQPASIGRYFEVRFDSIDGRNEVRAVYGGFGLAMAAVLLLAPRLPTLRAGILLTVALALAGMALGRVIGALVERPPGRWPVIFGVLEAGAATALWLASGVAVPGQADA